MVSIKCNLNFRKTKDQRRLQKLAHSLLRLLWEWMKHKMAIIIKICFQTTTVWSLETVIHFLKSIIAVKIRSNIRITSQDLPPTRSRFFNHLGMDLSKFPTVTSSRILQGQVWALKLTIQTVSITCSQAVKYSKTVIKMELEYRPRVARLSLNNDKIDRME